MSAVLFLSFLINEENLFGKRKEVGLKYFLLQPTSLSNTKGGMQHHVVGCFAAAETGRS